MLIWDCPDILNEWVGSRAGGRAHPGTCTALGWEDSGKIVAALVFYDSNGVNCNTNIAVEGGSFPVGLLKAGLKYTFGQLKLRRLTFIVSEGNIRSRKLCLGLGAILEATLREADKNGGNMLIFALFPENCKFWSRLNGKIERKRASRA
jgi:hypothetical protein